jgi:hypothetical protein
MDKNRLFIEDFVTIIHEKAEELLKEREYYSIKENEVELQYINGQLYTYFDILSTLKLQAQSFEIPVEQINLNKIDEYRYLNFKD